MEEFSVKNLVSMKYFLKIEVTHSSKGIILSQQKSIIDLLTEIGFADCQPAKTPIEVKHGLTWTVNELEANIGSYQRLVGKLIYLLHTRLDIAYAVNCLSQFMHNPRLSYLQPVHRVLRHLKGTVGWELHFKRQGTLSLDAYTDSDFVGSLTDRRSTTGYCTFLAEDLITWRSKKQEAVARSSTEAEFQAMSHGLAELMWIKGILKDLQIKLDSSTGIFCDNQSTIKVAHNPVQHDQMKLVSIDRHYIT